MENTPSLKQFKGVHKVKGSTKHTRIKKVWGQGQTALVAPAGAKSPGA